mmetsp:Transcript_3113/g.12083  ORF Transcript_3113/g.12083 Transcript_3113/m.12083 type:complete len:270 (+) Transcript_3113:1861-2670(+)
MRAVLLLDEPHQSDLQIRAQGGVRNEAEQLHEVHAIGHLVRERDLGLGPQAEAHLGRVLGLIQRDHGDALLREGLTRKSEGDARIQRHQALPIQIDRQHGPGLRGIVEDEVGVLARRQQNALHSRRTARCRIAGDQVDVAWCCLLGLGLPTIQSLQEAAHRCAARVFLSRGGDKAWVSLQRLVDEEGTDPLRPLRALAVFVLFSNVVRLVACESQSQEAILRGHVGLLPSLAPGAVQACTQDLARRRHVRQEGLGGGLQGVVGNPEAAD